MGIVENKPRPNHAIQVAIWKARGFRVCVSRLPPPNSSGGNWSEIPRKQITVLFPFSLSLSLFLSFFS